MTLFVCFDFLERCTSDIASVTPVATPTLAGLHLDRSRYFAEFDLPRCDDFGDGFAFAAAVAVFGFAMTDNNEQYCIFLWQMSQDGGGGGGGGLSTNVLVLLDEKAPTIGWCALVEVEKQ